MKRTEHAQKALRGLFLFAVTLGVVGLTGCETGADLGTQAPKPDRGGKAGWERTIRIRDNSQETTVTIEAARRPAVDVEGAIRRGLHTNTRLSGQSSDWPAVRIQLDQQLPDGVEGGRRANVIRVSGRVSSNRAQLEWVIAHEVAHLRWTRERGTVAEGLAELTAALVTGKQHPAQEDERCEEEGNRAYWCRYRETRLAWIALYEEDPAIFPARARRLHGALSGGDQPGEALDRIFGITDPQQVSRLTTGQEDSP